MAVIDKVTFDSQTTDETQTVIYTESLPADGEVWDVRIVCTAVLDDKSKREGFELIATVYRVSGATSIEGSVTSVHSQGGVNYDLDMDTDGTDFRVLATGITDETVDWNGTRIIEGRAS